MKYACYFAANLAKTQVAVGEAYSYFSITALACDPGSSGGVLFFVDMIEMWIFRVSQLHVMSADKYLHFNHFT